MLFWLCYLYHSLFPLLWKGRLWWLVKLLKVLWRNEVSYKCYIANHLFFDSYVLSKDFSGWLPHTAEECLHPKPRTAFLKITKPHKSKQNIFSSSTSVKSCYYKNQNLIQDLAKSLMWLIGNARIPLVVTQGRQEVLLSKQNYKCNTQRFGSCAKNEMGSLCDTSLILIIILY